MEPLYLVACVGQKLDREAPARELYTSPWFKKARAYVEARGGEWRILSALWGVLHPDELVEPYERTMADYCPEGRRGWAARVRAQLADVAPPERPIVMLAGEAYRKPLKGLGNPVAVPMQGMGIGEQLAWLTQQQQPEEAEEMAEQAKKTATLRACTDVELDVALIAYAHAIDVPVLDHEAALRAAIDKVLEMRRWRRREEREAAAAQQQPAAAAAEVV